MSDRIAFIFPGQGSQSVGMGAALAAASPAARAVYATADEALGFPLSTLCFEGPEDRLKETINTQPAITATSLAALAALYEALDITSPADFATTPHPAFLTGHSVGEFTAIIASGAITLADGMRLVRERGRLMHHEGTVCPGGMAAVLGLDTTMLATLCAQAEADVREDPAVRASTHPGAGKVVVANDNAPGQIVLSGEQTALARAMVLAQEAGAKRVIPLAVSGAFHSPVMAPAAAALRQAVDAIDIHAPAVPIIANVTGQPLTSSVDLVSELEQQIASPVQWVRSIEWMAGEGGVSIFVEVGAGQVLTGLVKRIAKGATLLNAGTPEEIAATAQILRARGFVA